MKGPPFLVGRLLNLTDQLHVEYCLDERKGQIPSQLLGSSLMPTALEQPEKAIALLCQRLPPYKNWATRLQSGERVGLTKYFLGEMGRLCNQLKECGIPTATALESDRVAPDTHARLMHGALTGGPVPDSILAACVARLRAEGSEGFRAGRMGLIKLCLNRTHFREEDRMSDALNPDETHPAYLYGRLLRVFEEIQYVALGDFNANVVDKFYGTFSAAKRMGCELWSRSGPPT